MPRSVTQFSHPLARYWPRLFELVALVTVILMLSVAGAARAATNVSGTISSNTTWTAAGSPYVMTGNVTVASGVTLTVEPGVTVQGNASLRQLVVNGSLVAEGTVGNLITFTSTADSAPGQWYGIRFSSSAGGSSLKHVRVRYGGSQLDDVMVNASGGSHTIEDSIFSDSSGRGLKVFPTALNGTGTTAVIRRSKFERNGGMGAFIQGAHVEIEDSAFWSNGGDGAAFLVPNGYVVAPSVVSGSSFWDNDGYGVWVSQDASVADLAPDGSGNAIYDNGTFGFSVQESWEQLRVTRASVQVDWRGNYWGPVTYVPCSVGSQTGHLSYGAPDQDPNAAFPIARGPVSSSFVYEDAGGGTIVWCGNDRALVNATLAEQPELEFPPPPPVLGGIALEQLFGCTDCDVDDPGVALAHDAAPGNGLAHTSRPVNTASGALVESATDLRLPGPGIPFAWTRSYGSRDTTAGALGVGWTHPFETKLTVVNPTTGELEYRAGSGQRTRFTKVSGGGSGAATYRGKGFDGTLKRLAANTYELKTRDLRTFSFDTAGKLTQIKPRFGPATTLAYTSGKLSSITDSAGRTITLTYSTSDPTLIERLTLADGRYVEYGYTSTRLTSVRDLRGKIWTLAYDGNGRLTAIEDPLGHFQIQDVVYDGNGRVMSEENGVGDAIEYEYTQSGALDVTTVTIPGRGDWVYEHSGNLMSEVIDPLGRSTSYTYDGMGRPLSVTDGRGHVTRFEYDAAGNVTKEIAPSSLGTVTRTFNATNDLLTEKDARGNTTSYVYGTTAGADYQVGQLKTVTDREGGVTTLKYWTTTSTPTPPSTNVGLLKTVQNPRLKTSSYDYDASGNLAKITSPLGFKTTMGYDSSGRLTSRRDPRGNVPVPPAGHLSEWAYDAVDHVTSFTDARGNVTTYDYYDNELLWKVTRNDGSPRVTSLEYDGDNRLWKTTDPRSGVETRLYWPDGQLKSVQSPESRKTSYEYDSAGQLIKLVEPNGNAAGATASDWTWTYGYDNAGNRTSEAHPDGGTREIDYDALNRPFEWTDPLSHVTSVEYDANGNVTKRTDGLSHFRTYTFDKLDRIKTETDVRLKTTTYSWYATGELESATTHLGNKTTYGLDDDGRTTSMVEPRGNVSGGTPSQYTWSYEYDPAGKRTRVTDPLGNDVEYAHDAVDNLTQVTDQRSNVTAFTYDALNRLWKVTPPAAGGTGTLDTVYAYDAAGNLSGRTDPNSHVTSWAYDLDGRQTQRTTPVGSWNYGYDANGNLKSLETPAGSSTGTAGDGTITYGYDRMSRQTSVDYSDSTPDVARAYDSAGRIQTMTDGFGTVTYTFDNADRLTAIARTGGGSGLNGTFGYGYDDAGNITGRTYPDSTTTSQVFDDDGRLTSVSSGGSTTSFGYDEAGNLTTTTLPSGNGHVATRTFDRAGRLTTVENAKSGTILSKFLWTLDAAGNPTKQRTTRGTTDTYDAFEYDTRNRLTASCFAVSAGATDCAGAGNKISYAYDKVSNRTQEVRTGSVPNTGTVDHAYNSADQLTQTVKGGNTTTYTYDANGNQATAGARSFTYNLADELVSTASGGTTTTYGYNGDGRRVSSTVGGGADLRFVWDPLADSGIPELALERTTAGGLVRRYLHGSLGAFSYTEAAGTFSYHADPIGTVTDVTNSSGAAQWTYEYEAYGSPLTTTNVSGSAPENRLRFNGQQFDPETSLYHLRARQYDSALGRFGALDSVENPKFDPYAGPYVYVNGRPLMLVDPLGTWPKFLDEAKDKLAGGAGWAKDKAEATAAWAHEKGRATAAKADELVREHVDPVIRKAATPIAAFGDGASLGLTHKVRERMGTNDVVDECSGWYKGGQFTGILTTSLLGEAVALKVGKSIYSRITASRAAKATGRAGDVAGDAARVAPQPSTPWGRTIQSFKDNPDDWRRISAHAEEATGKPYRGGVSIEEIFERGTDRLVRHRIYGPQGDILHQTFRPYAKFGAP